MTAEAYFSLDSELQSMRQELALTLNDLAEEAVTVDVNQRVIKKTDLIIDQAQNAVQNYVRRLSSMQLLDADHKTSELTRVRDLIDGHPFWGKYKDLFNPVPEVRRN
jgi:hypothetical protein